MGNIVEPKVILVNADELQNWKEKVGSFAAISHNTTSGIEKIAEKVIESQHATTYRGVLSFRFAISGVSRVWSHEDVRHKIGILNISPDEMDSVQRSQRYVVEDDFNYVKPADFCGRTFLIKDRAGHLNPMTYEDLMDITKQFYNEARKEGLSPQIARYVLPNSCETMINKVFSFQALQHYCAKRLCSLAQPEMRNVAALMVKEIREKVGEELANYFVVQCDAKSIGYCPEMIGDWKRCRRRPHKTEVIPDYTNSKGESPIFYKG